MAIDGAFPLSFLLKQVDKTDSIPYFVLSIRAITPLSLVPYHQIALHISKNINQRGLAKEGREKKQKKQKTLTITRLLPSFQNFHLPLHPLHLSRHTFVQHPMNKMANTKTIEQLFIENPTLITSTSNWGRKHLESFNVTTRTGRVPQAPDRAQRITFVTLKKSNQEIQPIQGQKPVYTYRPRDSECFQKSRL